MTMHADIAQAAAETYIGLVEVGVGLIPGGGGTKEFTKRVSDALEEGDAELNSLQNAFMTIATARVATSAEEAREIGILKKLDRVSMNKDRQIADAKEAVIELAAWAHSEWARIHPFAMATVARRGCLPTRSLCATACRRC